MAHTAGDALCGRLAVGCEARPSDFLCPRSADAFAEAGSRRAAAGTSISASTSTSRYRPQTHLAEDSRQPGLLAWRLGENMIVPGTPDDDSAGKTETPITPPTAQNTTVPPESVPQIEVSLEGSPSTTKASVRRPQSTGLTGTTGGVVAGLASQAAVLAAVLFYFGWARAKATYAYFGVDISVVNFSASDYILRSVDAALPLLLVIGLLGLGAMLVHERLRPGLVDNTQWANRLAQRAVWIGAAVVAAGFVLALSLTGPGGSDVSGPAILLIGCALTIYGLAVRNKYGTRDGTWDGTRFLMAMAAMALVALLWTVTAYASYIGIQVAEGIHSGLPSAAEVTIYSSANLSLSGPGISMSTIQAPNSKYHFRYSGLRILVSSGGQYFLLPSGWRQGHGSVIVLPATDGGNIRVEFTAPAP